MYILPSTCIQELATFKFNDISLNFFAPAKGASVTMLMPKISTALQVTWEKLQENDTNGNITGYSVCYATQLLSRNSCPKFKGVLGVQNIIRSI
jgi:hypothetical protein